MIGFADTLHRNPDASIRVAEAAISIVDADAAQPWPFRKPSTTAFSQAFTSTLEFIRQRPTS